VATLWQPHQTLWQPLATSSNLKQPQETLDPLRPQATSNFNQLNQFECIMP